MTALNRIEIRLSKSKLAKLLIFSILFLLVGLWMIIKQPQTRNAFFNSPMVKNFAAYGGTVMGILGIYFFSKKLFDNRPALVIDESGITDNTSVFSFGLIPWSDISGIYEGTIQASIASKQTFITIGVENPEHYILKEPGFVKRKLLALNEKNYGSPIHISTNSLKISHAELLRLMTDAFNRNKRID